MNKTPPTRCQICTCAVKPKNPLLWSEKFQIWTHKGCVEQKAPYLERAQAILDGKKT